MQRILLWCTFLLFLGTSVAHAAQYPLAITSTTTTITATLSGIPTTDTSDYELYNGTRPVGANTAINAASQIKKQSGGKVVWELSDLNIIPNSTYYFQAYQKGGTFGGVINTPVSTVVPFTFGTPTDTSLIQNFAIESTSDREVIVTGKIDTRLFQNPSNFVVVFSWSKSTPFTTTTEPSDRYTVTSGRDGLPAIAENGSYGLKISTLTSNQTYHFRQRILTGTGAILDTKLGTFDTTNGFVASGSQKEQEINDGKTYYLLAPWPGLSALMDPDLCLAQKNAKKIPQDAICDVNGFLDFAFKLMIGLTAVVLVLRLMYEGYQYVVTDIPYLMAKAKGGFFTALLGLLLALSAYLILNTINPKLVNNTINIDSVEVGVDEETDADPIIQDGRVAIPNGTVATCKEGITKVTTKGGVFYSCKSIATNLQSMIDLAWSKGIKLSGGGFRTKEQQIALRAAHCGGSSQYNVYEKPSSACRPPTARPGRSNHESGLAFDLTCNGQTIRARDNACFVWLQANAKNFGLINFSKEPWHWSVNGK